ncbi:hypothetical protein GCM10009550_46750 [Actinocorallia libanotica]|uniref:HTH tetR-type domain-containing protein n=2 Tax=Actinocorallia libanotica TaxID=46162 RepID=A0ABN1RJA0_9ACTN
MAAGRESFARRGLRGTSVEELARAAAISKGAFYRFFDGKEALLLALLSEHEQQVHARLEAAVRADPARGVALLVEESVHAAERDPLFAVLMSEEGMRVLASLSPAEQQELMERDVRLVRRVTGALRRAGAAPDVPERVLLGLLRSLVFAGMHRAEIGEDLLSETTAWLTDVLREEKP